MVSGYTEPNRVLAFIHFPFSLFTLRLLRLRVNIASSLGGSKKDPEGSLVLFLSKLFSAAYDFKIQIT